MAFLRSVDKHEPKPCRSTLGGVPDHQPAFVQLTMSARLRPNGLFDHLAVTPLDRVPTLAGLSLRPAPAGELTRAGGAGDGARRDGQDHDHRTESDRHTAQHLRS